MKIIATPVKGKNLRPGDLFSTAPQAYWDHADTHESIGEKVYIRTNEPCPENQREVEVYRITVKKRDK